MEDSPFSGDEGFRLARIIHEKHSSGTQSFVPGRINSRQRKHKVSLRTLYLQSAQADFVQLLPLVSTARERIRSRS